MKKITLSILLLLLGQLMFAQNMTSTGGEFKFNENKTPCLTEQQRAQIITSLQESVATLVAENKLSYTSSNKGGGVFFRWPVEKASGFSYNDVWGISNYVDHNVNFPNQITDYNCGTRSYDLSSGYNHQGIDIFTWPFGWRQMDNSEAIIKAAAPGQIIFKHDGEYDRNCEIGGNVTWNAVYIQHADGTVAWYGHMKNGSVITKNVGEMVTEGEILGTVGSSGFSTGPHLHFEIWENNSYTNLIDPYAGPCNNLNTASKWQSQKDYRDPKINAVITHTAPPNFNTCPETEITFESNEFNVDDTIYFGLYMRDQIAGTSVNLKITKPDNSILYNWNFDFDNTFSASWWYWSYTGVYDLEGDWTWEATYNGETVSHTFSVDDPLSISENELTSLKVYPNPFQDIISLNANSTIIAAKLIDVLGKTVLEIQDDSGISVINTKGLSQGLYFLKVTNAYNNEKTLKLIKE